MSGLPQRQTRPRVCLPEMTAADAVVLAQVLNLVADGLRRAYPEAFRYAFQESEEERPRSARRRPPAPR